MTRVLLLIAAGASLLRGEPVDARQCAECHPKIAASFAKTGMARSFYRLTPDKRVEDLSRGNPFFQAKSETWYRMTERDGRYFQKRWRVGYDGHETDVDELSVDFVMGSGNHVRTYLHRTARGTLIELPLAWYSEGGGHWGMNPGHDREVELPSRAVAYECMSCHNSPPKIPAGHEEPGSEYVYLDPLPEGIDCQRCHGPGGDHVRAARRAGATVAAVRAAIVNPARLSRDRQLEVCMQCHLETTSAQLPHSLVKFGRNPFSYLPGQPLGEFAMFFDRAPGSGHEQDFEIAHSAYRLRQSRCFLESKGAMTCTTCHDPHDVPRGAEAVTHYNGVCANCHKPHGAGDDCIACHMPKRRTRDVIGAVMTDHLIQRNAPRDALKALAETNDPPYRGPVVPYYPAAIPPIYQAVAQVTQGANLRAGIPALARERAKQPNARPEFYVELGQALLASGDKQNAVKTLEQAYRKEPASAVAAVALGDALVEAGEPKRAAEVLAGAARVSPNDSLLWYQLGLARSAADDAMGAVAAFEKTTALDPRMADAWQELGTLRAAAGDLDAAERAEREALRVQPDLAGAALVLGQVLSARRDFRQALYYFQRAVKADPGMPEAHNYAGTLLAASGDDERALMEFETATRLKPNYGDAHLNAAAMLAKKQNTAAARAHLEAAASDADPEVRRRAREALGR